MYPPGRPSADTVFASLLAGDMTMLGVPQMADFAMYGADMVAKWKALKRCQVNGMGPQDLREVTGSRYGLPLLLRRFTGDEFDGLFDWSNCNDELFPDRDVFVVCNQDQGEFLLWNNEDGWIDDLDRAEKFPGEEILAGKWDLPMEGIWISVEAAGNRLATQETAT